MTQAQVIPGSTDMGRRAAALTAPHKVVRSDGKFQVRDYPALTVMETPMAAVSRALSTA